MAGYIVDINHRAGGEEITHPFEFHIDTPEVARRIIEAAPHKRVIMLQLDGDELDAALWGLENYVKGGR